MWRARLVVWRVLDHWAFGLILVVAILHLLVPLAFDQRDALSASLRYTIAEVEEGEQSDTLQCLIPAKPKPKPSTIYFLHVPKAGGSALVLVVLHFMGPRVVQVKKDCFTPGFNGSACNPDEDPECRMIINCVDHQSRLEHLGRPDIPSIAIVRHPIAR